MTRKRSETETYTHDEAREKMLEAARLTGGWAEASRAYMNYTRRFIAHHQAEDARARAEKAARIAATKRANNAARMREFRAWERAERESRHG